MPPPTALPPAAEPPPATPVVAAEAYKSGEPSPEDKVPFGTKLAFSSGSFAGTWAGGSLGALVNPIFVVMFGLSPTLVSLAQVLYRIYDAFVDLSVGSASDNARTRWGRRRPFIFVGSVLAGLWLPMMWMFNPEWSKHTLAIWMVVCFLVFYFFESLFNIPWQSLLLEMTPDTNERTNVAAIKGYTNKAAAILPSWVWALTLLPIFHGLGGGKIPDALVGARWVTFGIGLLVILTGIMPAIFVKERFYKTASHQAKVSMAQNLKYTFSNRPFVILAIFSLLFLVGSYGKSQLSFFTTLYYVCNGNEKLAAELAGWGGTLTLFTGLAGIPLFQWLANHYGKHRALAMAMWITLLASVSTYFFFTPKHPYLSVLSGILLAPAGTGMWILIPSMTGDVADYDELLTGERREGAFAAVYSWVFKLSLSVAAGFAGPLVDLAGYRTGVAVQTEATLTAMRIMLVVLPAICIGAAIFVLRFYGLDRRRIAEVRAELEARRGKM